MIGLQLPLTGNPWTTLSDPCNKVRGKYICKEVFLRLPSCVVYSCVCLCHCVCYHCVGMYPAYICIFLHEHADEYITIVHTLNSSPLRGNLFRLQCTCCTVPTTSGRTHGSPLVWACQWPSSQPLSSSQLSHNDSLWA